MDSLILKTATRFLITLFLLASLYVLLRGHEDPGGGFIGGLIAAAAFALFAIAHDLKAAKRLLLWDPLYYVAFGLLFATVAGLIAAALGLPFLTGVWPVIEIPGLAEPLETGTYLLFDLGVFLLVIGASLTILFSLMEAD